jgi:hypothetical protein
LKHHLHFILLLTILFPAPNVSFATSQSYAVIEGTAIIDDKIVTENNDNGYTIKLLKTDGTPLLPVAEDSDGVNANGLYHIEIPLYDAINQSGVNPGETVLINVLKGNNKLKIKSPLNGIVKVGVSGSITKLDIVAVSNMPVLSAVFNLLLSDNDLNEPEDSFKMTYPIKISEYHSSGGPIYINENGAIYILYDSDEGVHFIKSIDQGSTFTSPIEIFPPGNKKNSQCISIAVNGDYIHTTWVYLTYDGNTEVLYSRSKDGGQSFDPPAYISLVDGINSVPSSLASNGKNYVGVFTSNSEPGTGINFLSYTFSEDNGETFEYPTIISTTGIEPNITSADNYVYLVWIEGNTVYVAVSNDFGRTFFEPVKNFPNYEQPHVINLHITKNGDLFMILCDEHSNGLKDVRIFKSRDHGLTFDSFLAVPNIDTRSVDAIIDDDENIYISWAKNRNLTRYDDIKTYFMYSTDKGVTFNGPILLPYIYSEVRYTLWGPWLAKLQNNKIIFTWVKCQKDDPLYKFYQYMSIGTIPEH